MSNQRLLKNRTQAGELLAVRLSAYTGRSDVVVVALPRGGVPVGHAIATALEVPFDILLVRKLGMPDHEEFAIGAIATGGVRILRGEAISASGIPAPTIEALVERESMELKRRELLYRADRPPLQLRERVVILVDDGIATGSSMQAAIQVARKACPSRLIVAVPVAPEETREKLQSEVDELICLSTPEPFYAVGMWYQNFDQTSDDEVKQLLEEAWSREGELAPGTFAMK